MSDTAPFTARRRPRFERASSALPFSLTERDQEIVRQVARHRFLRSTHISQLLDAPHKKVCERLTSLYHAGYLDRPRAQLEHHVAGGGSAPYVYALGNRGAQLLRGGEAEHREVNWADKNRHAGRYFLLHTLAIADLRVALALACRIGGAMLQEPSELLLSASSETRAEKNPWHWRVSVQHDHRLYRIGVVPDYAFALILRDGRRRPFLVECDRGTMPVERSTLDQTSLLRKVLAYEASRQQGLHTSRYGWKDFRVLFIASSEERAKNICALLDHTQSVNRSPLFLVTNHDGLMQSAVLSHRWQDGKGGTHALV